MAKKNNETTVNKKEIPFLGEIKSKEVNLISTMEESKYIVIAVEKYIDIITTKSFAMGKLSILEKTIEEIKREQYISKLKGSPIRKKQLIIKKLEDEITILNSEKLLEIVTKKQISEYEKAKQIGKIEGIKLAIERIKETE